MTEDPLMARQRRPNANMGGSAIGCDRGAIRKKLCTSPIRLAKLADRTANANVLCRSEAVC